MIKHPGFAEEKEWRIVVPDPSASIMSFQRGEANVKAFVQIKNHTGNRKLPLKELYYGPTLRNDAALGQTLVWILEKYGYGDVEPKACPIPYRL